MGVTNRMTVGFLDLVSAIDCFNIFYLILYKLYVDITVAIMLPICNLPIVNFLLYKK
jgi:hypothetical protein